MTNILFYISLNLFILSALWHIIAFIIFKREDVSFKDAMFYFPAKHGAMWYYRKPQEYYKEFYVKYVHISTIIAIVCLMAMVFSPFLYSKNTLN